MKSPKFPASTSRAIPITKPQIRIAVPHWSLKFGPSLACRAAASARRRVFGSWCLLFLILPAASAQSYSIDWFTIDGGGGTSTGGVYQVSGTIGQPDAGHMAGAGYTVDGGFWSFISAMQTAGSPLLTIARTTTNTVAVSWPSPSAGFTLQQNTNGVATPNWSNAVTTPNDNGTTKTIIVNPPTGNRFYRLFKP